jgi:hypothetical protein
MRMLMRHAIDDASRRVERDNDSLLSAQADGNSTASRIHLSEP